MVVVLVVMVMVAVVVFYRFSGLWDTPGYSSLFGVGVGVGVEDERGELFITVNLFNGLCVWGQSLVVVVVVLMLL